MSKRKNRKKRIDAMSAALFLFAASVMMFIGVTGVMHIGTSYAIGVYDTKAPKEINVFYTKGTDDFNYTLIPWVTEDGQNSPINYETDFKGKNVDTSDNTIYHLYCLEKSKSMPFSGKYIQDESLTSRYVDEGIKLIVTQAYPYNGSFLDGEEVKTKKAVTQWAIWYYLDKKGIAQGDDKLTAGELAAISSNNKYAKEIRSLVDMAMAAQVPAAPTLSLEESGTWSISDDGKYLITPMITPVGSNGNDIGYKVKLNDNPYGAEIVESITVSAPDSLMHSPFEVHIPMANIKNLNEVNLSFSVVGTFIKQKVYAYRGENTDQQTALVAEFEYETQEVPYEATWKVPTGKVKVSKQDITTSKELAGATMVITNCRGNVVAEWVSSDKPFMIDALPVNDTTCKYQLFESEAPQGYELSKEVIEFDVKNDGSVTELVYKNNPLTPTPDTGLNIPFTVYIAGGIILICGIAIIYASVKPKKEN